MEDGTQAAVSTSEISLHAFIQPFSLIIFSEIGDKTFLIAAILAMRHQRQVVFAGAFGALFVMSILSALLGHVLPALIPKSKGWTQVGAAVLFFVFGAKMLSEGWEMKAGRAKMEEEMREAEEEIEEDEAGTEGGLPLATLERGERVSMNGQTRRRSRSRSPSLMYPAKSKERSRREKLVEGTRNFFSLLLGPVFVQAFALTFLGEWGDRSQIATIALGAAHVNFLALYFPSRSLLILRCILQNVYVVALGTIIGHACCTALAVIGGRYVSTKISVRHGKQISVHSLCPCELTL